jgi:hypothetical protein
MKSINSDKNINKQISKKESKLLPDKNSAKNSSPSISNSNIVNSKDNILKHNNMQKQNKRSAKSKVSDISIFSKNSNNQIDEKKQKINNILGELKLKYNYQLSPSTDIKSFGELIPGPGQYYNPEIKIGQGQNLRYNNLFKDPELDLTLKYKILKDNYYQSKIGPGTYNLNNGYKSYSQNPKTFISKLERGPLFKISDSVGPGYYNLGKSSTKRKNRDNNIKIKNVNKNKFILKTSPFFEPNDIKVVHAYNKDNKNLNGKISFKGHKNFSWKGISDFSGLGIKVAKTENKEMIKNDNKIEYKNQEFNFDNQKKLNKKKFSRTTRKIILKEISEYNKVNEPLIQYVPKDVVPKGNHLPGPCYYNYTNDSIEGDIKNLNKKYNNKANKKWK